MCEDTRNIINPSQLIMVNVSLTAMLILTSLSISFAGENHRGFEEAEVRKQILTYVNSINYKLITLIIYTYIVTVSKLFTFLEIMLKNF